MELEEPVYVIGRSVRVKHGAPECFSTIGSLISDFYADDMPSKIPNRKEPLMRYDICSDHKMELWRPVKRRV